MSAAGALLPEDELQCSICLEIFTNPVSLPCGHNFCRGCISRHWQQQQQQQQQRRCPLCSHQFRKALKLHVNTGFRDIVENFKKQQGAAAKNNPYLQSADVPCDCCLDNKVRALKTCLVCLASFCETHLEAHHRVPALMSHTLAEPVRNLAEKICKKHMRMLGLFCKDDLTRCCDLCPEHLRHNTVNLEEEYEEKKSQLEKEKVGVDEMIHEREKMIQEIEEAAQSQKKNKDQVIVDTSHTFSASMASIHRDLIQLHCAIEEKQRGAERRAETLVQELKKEVADLQRRGNKLQNISQNEDPIQLIKSFHSLSSWASNSKIWSSVSLHSGHGAEAVSKALLQLEETLGQQTENAGRDFRSCCTQILHEESESETRPSQMVTDLQTVPEGIRLDIIRQQYEVDMTFDPHTANELLIFSKDLKEVQAPHLWWCVNQVPHMFTNYAFTLGRRGFSRGRFYYEVSSSMKSGWDLGVVREALRGKKQFTLSSRDGGWVIRLRNNTNLKALHHKPLNIPLTKKPERVGVFVDYEEGLVSFYDVDSSSLIYSFTGCSFNGRIFPFFSPGPSDNGINGAPLVLSTPTASGVRHSQNIGVQAEPSDTLFQCLIIAKDPQQYLQNEAGRFFQQAWKHPIDGLFWFLSFVVVVVVAVLARALSA